MLRGFATPTEKCDMSWIMRALVAGMALGSDGMERTLTETEQRLAIAGDWEGTWNGSIPCRWAGTQRTCTVRLNPESMSLQGNGFTAGFSLGTWIDEGKGYFRIEFEHHLQWWGIYKREYGCLVICLVQVDSGLPLIIQAPRPTRFQPGKDQALLILKPAKLPKK
jgi:hypothetical protein